MALEEPNKANYRFALLCRCDAAALFVWGSYRDLQTRVAPPQRRAPASVESLTGYLVPMAGLTDGLRFACMVTEGFCRKSARLPNAVYGAYRDGVWFVE